MCLPSLSLLSCRRFRNTSSVLHIFVRILFLCKNITAEAKNRRIKTNKPNVIHVTLSISGKAFGEIWVNNFFCRSSFRVISTEKRKNLEFVVIFRWLRLPELFKSSTASAQCTSSQLQCRILFQSTNMLCFRITINMAY